MASFKNCSRRIAALTLFSLILAGCGGEGDSGSPGPVGPGGADGPTGPTGANDVPVTSAETITVHITDVAVSADGGAPLVSFFLTNELDQGLVGLPAANIRFVIAQLTPGTSGGSSEWQSYVTRDDGGVANAQADAETATSGTYVDNGDSTYTYTFANALTGYPAGPTFDATRTHRVGIEIRTNSNGFWPVNIPANNAPHDFMPAGAAPVFTRLIVDNDTCNACHDNLEAHGEARFDVEYCVQCHNPSSIDGNTGNSVDMKVLIHNIHSARSDYQIIGYGNRPHDWADVVFPQDIRNCQTCHDESDANTPQASNWRLVPSRAACGTCHYDDGDAMNGQNDYAIDAGIHPLEMTFTDDMQCVDCHGADATVLSSDDRLVQIPVAHAIPEDIAAEAFQFNIIGVSGISQGGTPVVRFSVTDPTNGNASYDIHTDPAFTECATRTSRLAIGIAWDTDDYTNAGTGNAPAQPISMNPLTAPGCGGTSTDEGGGEFSVTSPTQVPMTQTGTAAVTIDGHPSVVIDGTATSIAVTSPVFYAGITDLPAVPRRNAVAIEKCDDCHNKLSMHGNNRTDNIEVCVTCHNPNATDTNRRDVPCTDTLGPDDAPIDMKVMIHALHGYSKTEVPYEVCGYGNFPHTFDFTYPGRLNNCEGCHNPGGYYPVEPGAILATTIDAGADATSPTDDTAVSPNAAVCSACHVSNDAMQHMIANGGDFAAGKAADSSLISSGIESCVVCHGPGRALDVKEVHGVGTFLN